MKLLLSVINVERREKQREDAKKKPSGWGQFNLISIVSFDQDYCWGWKKKELKETIFDITKWREEEFFSRALEKLCFMVSSHSYVLLCSS